MSEFFRLASRADMVWVAPYIGSLTTLLFMIGSIPVIIFVQRGWMIILGSIVVLGVFAGIDWAFTEHGRQAKQAFYQSGNLVIPKWIFRLNRDLSEFAQGKGYGWKHSFYRCWIETDHERFMMYTFPKIPWRTTVIGFDDEASRNFYLLVLREIYAVDEEPPKLVTL